MKMMKAVLVMALVLALATPALAELKLNGYYRVQGTAQNATGGAYDQWGVSEDSKTDTFVDQRLRMMLTNQFNESVKLVYFGEVDTPWGMSSKGGVGGGGKLGADGVNLETKQVYLNFLTAGWDFTVGIQNMGDHVAAIVFDNDVAGITAKTKMGAAGLTLRYAKLDEDDGGPNDADTWNDSDMYAAQTSFTLSDAARLGADVFWFDNNTNDTEELYVSVDGDFNFGPANLTGFALYGSQDGDQAGALDGDNWMASAQIMTKLGDGNISLRAIYYQDADDQDDVLFINDHGTAFQFYGEGLMIFLTDVYYNNGTQGGLYKHATENGHGLSALTMKGNMGFADGYYLKYAAGAFMANDDTSYSGVVREGEYMGTEVDLMIGKKFNEKIDLSLRGAYAFLGEFFDDNVNGDPDDAWKAVAMINVSY